MASVSEASRTGPEGGRSAPSPFAREGAEGGLSKLIRSAGITEGLSFPLVNSKSKSAILDATPGVSKSYVSESDVVKSMEVSAGIQVMGKGEGTSATRALGAPWFTEGELVVASLAEGFLSLSTWLPGSLLVSTALRLNSVGSEAVGYGSGLGFEAAVVAREEAVFAGVSVSEATAGGCMGGLVTGGLGAGFLVWKEGEDDGEDTARGDTGGLTLAFSAASLGECLRLGGIGVSDFGALVCSGVQGGEVFFSFSSGVTLALCSTNGAILASTAEVEINGVGGAVFDSGVGAGARTGVGEGSEGSLAGVDRLQVRVVVSLEGLS